MRKFVQVGSVRIGGGAPVSIQSMTNTDTRDIQSTAAQINALADAGCDLVRMSVYDTDCVSAIPGIRRLVHVPLVADIHFDHRLAIGAIEQGIDKLRLNPGNIPSSQHVAMVADCAKRHHVPIRIGVNSGSVPRDILVKESGVTANALVESALRHVRLLEAEHFDDIVISVKSSNLTMMVEACRLLDRQTQYPQHIGVTESGLPGQGTIKSAIGIGALLLDGIGDTVRVSLSGSPLPEAEAARQILKAVGLLGGVQLISCPTCGRTQVDIAPIAKEIEDRTRTIRKNVTVAVMGCVVNGPGEAKEADIALCGGKDACALYVKGVFIRKLTGHYADAVLDEIERLDNEGGKSD